MWKQTILSVMLLSASFIGCTSTPKETVSPFIQVKDGQFIRNGQPYYYIGANFWYGAILASEGTGGNRERLHQELDSLKAIGVDNLRILVGADGKRGVPTKVEPTLQEAPGVYNDTILAGLDYLLAEMEKRDMVAVLYLNNSWEWSGGYSQYLAWAKGCERLRGIGQCASLVRRPREKHPRPYQPIYEPEIYRRPYDYVVANRERTPCFRFRLYP